MSYKAILFEEKDNIGILTLNMPDKLNMMSLELIEELRDCFAALRNNYEIRAVILKAAGRAFCAGLDLKEGVFEAAGKSNLGDPQYKYKIQQAFSDTVVNMRRCPQPIIAVIKGSAVGAGFSLTLACDVRVAGESARFNAAYIKVGLSGGDVGSTYFLPRLIGLSRASEYLYTGDFIDANTADKIGLVSRLVSDDKADEVALQIASAMLKNSPFGLRMTKESINANVDAPGIESALHIENRTQVLALLSDDFKEGTQAFLEKRTPQYKDR